MPVLPRNTYKTPHGFQFHLVVTEDLRQFIGKREIKKPLGKDYTTAAYQAKLLAVQVDRQLVEPAQDLDHTGSAEGFGSLSRHTYLRVGQIHSTTGIIWRFTIYTPKGKDYHVGYGSP